MNVTRASAKNPQRHGSVRSATALSARLLSKLSLAPGHRPRFDPRDLTGGHFMALSDVTRREMIGAFAAGGPSSRTRTKNVIGHEPGLLCPARSCRKQVLYRRTPTRLTPPFKLPPAL